MTIFSVVFLCINLSMRIYRSALIYILVSDRDILDSVKKYCKAERFKMVSAHSERVVSVFSSVMYMFSEVTN